MGTARPNSFHSLLSQCADQQLGEGAMILMVGEPQRMQTLKKHFPERSGIFFIEYCDLTKDILGSINPDSVVAPAISEKFDCLELADFLDSVGFNGSFRVIVRNIPRPDIIRNEIRARFPKLDFDVLRPEPVTRPKLAFH